MLCTGLQATAHSTSKIARFEDVYRASSFGFRGEALHLIADACEELRLVTKSADDGDLGGEAIRFVLGQRKQIEVRVHCPWSLES